MRSFVPRLRELAAVAVIGVFGTQLVVHVVRTLIDGGARPMYIDPWLFLLLVFGTSLSVAGLVIGAVAIAMLWIRRRPRPTVMQALRGERLKVIHGPSREVDVEIIGRDGRPL